MSGERNILEGLRGKLIVSCQPVPDGPFDNVATVVAYARAAEAAGAAGLRIEGSANVAAVVQASALPVIGLVKRDLKDSSVRITPLLSDVIDLCEAGAAIVAVDATDRPRPVPVGELLGEIKRRGRVAMADISTQAEARSALAAGADIVGTTMSGYASDAPTPKEPDLDLVRLCAVLGAPVFAEGRYNSPEMAGAAIRAGAGAVVVGSAITRPEHITDWFRQAVATAARPIPAVLAFDIGGTKTIAALVQGRIVIERRVIPTPADVGSESWLAAMAGLASGWGGRYDRAAAAVTGRIDGGVWSALNPGTLAIPHGFTLASALGASLGMRVVAVNDAQAAAWGEYRFGAGQGRDMAFLTISSGIGGGLVLGGRLHRGARGIAGSLGQIPVSGAEGSIRLETLASGFGIAQAARGIGHDGDARAVFTAAHAGESWARDVLHAAAARLAVAIAGLQAVADPERIVIGGGVGLAGGFIEMLREALAVHPQAVVPDLVIAELGSDAGIVGVADMAVTSW
ncbi:N-acetylmannosamine kinase [Rhizobium sp. Root73]|uniref:putative N-acetylmannosamine-6-phosphate 2-epimerase n=1 Tax=unclassified Rhizobium TaxID=2613769 RepID=UPI00072BF64C|nr:MULTISPECIES: putative N-acetylmannosamine-6-phosphate 2-epimerase [unclassified Rhizobium]KQY15083.1 N-acetylmannosamine kinase [Rhizobium sp. Root1334]KRC06511.1 N-acetylmannosamine kinase [Rhizobium sp. Root73]